MQGPKIPATKNITFIPTYTYAILMRVFLKKKSVGTLIAPASEILLQQLLLLGKERESKELKQKVITLR